MTMSPDLRRQMDCSRSSDLDASSPELDALRAAVKNNPEVAEALKVSLQNDQVIAAALREVPVPAGLRERISATLAHSPAEQQVSLADNKANRRQVSRRTVGVIAVLASAAAMAGLWLGMSPRTEQVQHVSQAELTTRSEAWIKEAFAVSGWRDDVDSIPAGLGKDSVVRGKIVRWREILSGPEPKMVALDLTPAGEAAKALLLVALTKAEYDLTTLPVTTLPTSGKLRTVAWQKDQNLFVLAVQEEDGQRLEQFLRTQQLTLSYSLPR